MFLQVHPKAPHSVQSVVVRNITAVRVRHLRPHHDQHDHARDEVPQPAAGVQQGSRYAQHVVHCGLCVRVHIQTGCF